MRNILPRGQNCFYSGSPLAATQTDNLDLGPNAYLTGSGGPFTSLHQDGSGFVDSVHINVRGYNEVVICDPCDEERFKQGMRIIWGKDSTEEVEDSYPHERRDSTCHWPTKEVIKELKDAGFAPKVLILKPGQLLYIPAGAPHAFRKCDPTNEVPLDDAHHLLRIGLLRSGQYLQQLPGLFLSIAFDFLLMGTDDSLNSQKLERILTWYGSTGRNEKLDRQSCPLFPLYSLFYDRAMNMVADSESPHNQPFLFQTLFKVLLDQFKLERLIGNHFSNGGRSLVEKQRDSIGDEKEDDHIITCTNCGNDTNTYYVSEVSPQQRLCPSCAWKCCENKGSCPATSIIQAVYRDMRFSPNNIQAGIDSTPGVSQQSIDEFNTSFESLVILRRLMQVMLLKGK